MMEFGADKPIYRQVADYCAEQIACGALVEGARLPSTKELAIELAVNNRTVMKAYDTLSDAGVIFQRRGLGYFVADNAAARLKEFYRQEFVATTIPELRRTLQRAGIPAEELIELLKQ